MIHPFYMAAMPQVHFGTGKIQELPKLIADFGQHVLIVTGGRSFVNSKHWEQLQTQLQDAKITWRIWRITGEPSPAAIDACVKTYQNANIQLVVAIGGGSVVDAGKAIAAMLHLKDSVQAYLEGVGTKTHDGKTLPFIAVPTTAGTGSEATKNSVLSSVGEQGFKKSLRHNNFIPNIALIDPMLMVSCPAQLTANSGMDAFTQLLESYLSTKANPMTDALALDGLKGIQKGLLAAYQNGENIEARQNMAYATFISGITLANVGLGTVHGFASSVGGRVAVPHGIVCGTLMGIVNKLTLQKLRTDLPNAIALKKYAIVGRLFSTVTNQTDNYYQDSLIDLLENWTETLQLPTFSAYGMTADMIPNIVQNTGNKNNPIALNEEELRLVLESRL